MTQRRVRTPLRRSIERFLSDPASVRNAAAVMIVATVTIVLVAGLIVWLFDREDFPDYPGALWYALQTVTTVGYGDKVPTSPIGRLVGALVMVTAVALVAIVTASITSTFVEAAQRRRRDGQQAKDDESARALNARLDEIATRLTAIERAVGVDGSDQGPAALAETTRTARPAAEA